MISSIISRILAWGYQTFCETLTKRTVKPSGFCDLFRLRKSKNKVKTTFYKISCRKHKFSFPKRTNFNKCSWWARNHLYKYRRCVPIPPMSLIDDILAVTVCGVDSLVLNAAVQSKIDTRRLTLSKDKCVKMHIGEESSGCPDLRVHDRVMKSSETHKYLFSKNKLCLN